MYDGNLNLMASSFSSLVSQQFGNVILYEICTYDCWCVELL